MKGIIAIGFSAAMLMGLTQIEATAQSASCKVEFTVGMYACGSAPAGSCFSPFPVPAPAVYTGSCGPWCSSYWIWGTCKKHEPRCNHCSRPTAAQPIDLATGNTYITQTDISLPGLGGGLTLSRIWNSIPSASYAAGRHMFGLGWQSTYEDRLILQSNSEGLLFEEDGGDDETAFGFLSFGPNTYSAVAPSTRVATLTTHTNSSNTAVTDWTQVFKNGEKRVYDPNTGFLVSIIDRNGNTTSLSYDSSNRLTTVTDPASRHLNFTYQSSTSNLVTSVSSDVGITYSYAYDTSGRLTQVTKPDNTTVSFAYDSNNRITTVTDNNGKVLESHTYDSSGRGLTSSRANGVEAVSVSY